MNSVLQESKTWLYVSVSTNIDLSTTTVSMSIVPQNQRPGTWYPATWSDPTTARVLIGPGTSFALTPGVYSVYVQVVAGSESPVLPAGILTVK